MCEVKEPKPFQTSQAKSARRGPPEDGFAMFWAKLVKLVNCVLTLKTFFKCQEGGEEDVGVPGVGVIGDRSPETSPKSLSWSEGHFGI